MARCSLTVDNVSDSRTAYEIISCNRGRINADRELDFNYSTLPRSYWLISNRQQGIGTDMGLSATIYHHTPQLPYLGIMGQYERTAVQVYIFP